MKIGMTSSVDTIEAIAAGLVNIRQKHSSGPGDGRYKRKQAA